jgi:molybdopterin-guanine dinucleotide biosynthesis protein
MKAFSPSEVLKMKKETIPFTGAWQDAFGNPEWTGTWIVWGNSGDGKTSFIMQLCKELSRWRKVGYDSLEQRASKTMQDTIREYNMQQCPRGRFQLIPGENIAQLNERLLKPKAPDVVVIDSYQYTQMSYKEYVAFKEKHPDKLIIFASHADGTQPDGRAAKKVRYDAELKIRVEGFRAISLGRTIGDKGYYTVYEQGALDYGWTEL